ncbi:hypothetical protein acdb102_17610 [Acidothermaceae bacterium B102]|nr:hypothetical protein acdb102_17610 [Acidothermaceae bacterium B102]
MPGCGCPSYAHGHNIHWIPATKANSDPTSWFPAHVVSFSDELTTVVYGDGDLCELWRHTGLEADLAVGEQVFVSELWSLLACAADDGHRQLSARIEAKIWRKYQLPEDRPRPFAAGIVDLATGEGIIPPSSTPRVADREDGSSPEVSTEV